MVQKSLLADKYVVKVSSLQSTEFNYTGLTAAIAAETARIELVGRVMDITFHRDGEGVYANIYYRLNEAGSGK